MAVYFNEHEPYAAQWLRNLYPTATVDERSIHEVQAADLVGHERVHLFGGIGGWEYALQLAGWTWPVWSGSCPCQPFSAAGKRKGEADERHLWPEMFRLIRECRPATVFGEQVASGDAMRWLDGIFADLERAGYACGSADLCSAGVGSPNIRQRLFWVANSSEAKRGRRTLHDGRRANVLHASVGGPTDRLAHAGPPSPRHGDRSHGDDTAQRSEAATELARRGDAGGLANTGRRNDWGSGCGESPGRGEPGRSGRGMGDTDTRGLGAGSEQPVRQPSEGCEFVGLGDTSGTGPQERRDGGRATADLQRETAERTGDAIGMGDTDGSSPRCGEQRLRPLDRDGNGPAFVEQCSTVGMEQRASDGQRGEWIAERRQGEAAGASPWSDYRIIPCKDGKSRRISAQRSDEPLAARIPREVGLLLAELEQLGHDPKAAKRIIRDARRNRNGRLKGYGNAINPHVAAVFVRAVMEVLGADSHAGVPSG